MDATLQCRAPKSLAERVERYAHKMSRYAPSKSDVMREALGFFLDVMEASEAQSGGDWVEVERVSAEAISRGDVVVIQRGSLSYVVLQTNRKVTQRAIPPLKQQEPQIKCEGLDRARLGDVTPTPHKYETPEQEKDAPGLWTGRVIPEAEEAPSPLIGLGNNSGADRQLEQLDDVHPFEASTNQHAFSSGKDAPGLWTGRVIPEAEEAPSPLIGLGNNSGACTVRNLSPHFQNPRAARADSLARGSGEDDTQIAREHARLSPRAERDEGALGGQGAPASPSRASSRRRKKNAKRDPGPALFLARKVLMRVFHLCDSVGWIKRRGNIAHQKRGRMIEAPPLPLIWACEEVQDWRVWDDGLTQWAAFAEHDPAVASTKCYSLWVLIKPPKCDPEGPRFIERFATPGYFDDWTAERIKQPGRDFSARLSKRAKNVEDIQGELFSDRGSLERRLAWLVSIVNQSPSGEREAIKVQIAQIRACIARDENSKRDCMQFDNNQPAIAVLEHAAGVV